jgi:hypothetical protein
MKEALDSIPVIGKKKKVSKTNFQCHLRNGQVDRQYLQGASDLAPSSKTLAFPVLKSRETRVQGIF